MPAFSLEHERDRIEELASTGLTYDAKRATVEANLRTYLLERTGAPSSFGLDVESGRVQQDGYSHRGDGDLDASFKKSEEEATSEVIAKRYNLETRGYSEVKKKFFELPIGSTILLFSPPPDNPIPGYPGHSMAYFYHILPDVGGDKNKRTIKALAWVNNFEKEEQAEILNNRGAEEHVQPTEESILTNPIFDSTWSAGTLSFQRLWEKMGEVYSRKPREGNSRYFSYETAEKYLLYGQEVWETRHKDLAAMTANLAQRLIKGESTQSLSKDWDIMLNLADQELVHVDVTKDLPQRVFGIGMPGRLIFDRYQDLAYAPQVRATPCGLSAGLGSYDDAPTSSLMTATFSVENVDLGDSLKKLKCTCPFCEEKVEAVIKSNKITCPSCNKSAPYNC